MKKSKILNKNFRKSESFPKIFLNFFGNYFFDMKKSIFFDDFFSKFISWSRRIHLKRFQSDSGCWKIRKLKEKSVCHKLEVYGGHLGSDNDMRLSFFEQTGGCQQDLCWASILLEFKTKCARVILNTTKQFVENSLTKTYFSMMVCSE